MRSSSSPSPEGRRAARAAALGATLAAALGLVACGYLGLLRPSVIKQLNPRVVRMVNFFPEVDDPNEAIVGRLVGHGGLSRAELGDDGVMRDRVWVPEDEFIWEPAIVVMERPGELELDFTNGDRHPHAAILPDRDGKQHLWLPVRRAGRARLRLDHPGMYTFACPVGNHAGRGMLGIIIVRDDTPPEAKLDRPEQPRP